MSPINPFQRFINQLNLVDYLAIHMTLNVWSERMMIFELDNKYEKPPRPSIDELSLLN